MLNRKEKVKLAKILAELRYDIKQIKRRLDLIEEEKEKNCRCQNPEKN